MDKKGKLELTWVGKYEEEKLEPRILIEDKSNRAIYFFICIEIICFLVLSNSDLISFSSKS